MTNNNDLNHKQLPNHYQMSYNTSQVANFSRVRNPVDFYEIKADRDGGGLREGV